MPRNEFTLCTFGTLELRRAGTGECIGSPRRKSLALLALAAAHPDGIPRDRAAALLWPDADLQRSRHSLTQAIYLLRRELEIPDPLVGDVTLRINAEQIASDIEPFTAAIAAGKWAEATALHAGPFLDAVFFKQCVEFERWAEDRRASCARDVKRALVELAKDAQRRGAVPELVTRWTQAFEADPLDSDIALNAAVALQAAGARLDALRLLRTHEERLAADIDVQPSDAIRELQASLKLDRGIANPRVPVAVPELIERRRPPVAPPNPAAPPPTWKWRNALLVGLCGIALLTGVAIARTRHASAPEGGTVVLVAPFRVASTSPELHYLREGLLDLVVARLATAHAVRTIEPRVALAKLPAAQDATTQEVIAAARELGARFVVTGSAVGVRQRLLITVLLRDTAGTEFTPVTVTAPEDSLPALVDEVVGHLLAAVSGEPPRSRGLLARHSTQAVRAYIEGQAAYREGRWADAMAAYRIAIQHDSTFALASLGLVSASLWTRDYGTRARAERLAWQAREDLAPADRSYLEALVGPAYPKNSTTEERFAAWERASRLAGDRAEVWFALGDDYFHNGAIVGREQPLARAKAAFERALQIQPTYSAPLTHLLQVRAREGDVRGVAALADRVRQSASGEEQFFVRWRIARSLSDKDTLTALQSAFNTAAEQSLIAIALTSMFEGIAPDDGERAVRALLARAVTSEDRRNALMAKHAFALARGRPAEAGEALTALQTLDATSSETQRLLITDALYAGGDTTRAIAAARALETKLRESRSASPEDDRCALEQWRLANRDTIGVRDRITALVVPRADAVERAQIEARVCANLLNAMAAVQSKDGPAALARLDSILRAGPATRMLPSYATLALARLYLQRGDTANALKAVRRVSGFGRWPRYIASYRALEHQLTAPAAAVAAGRE